MAEVTREQAMRLITIERAREMTGLDLVSARDTESVPGRTYHQMEEETESKSHQSAREEGIAFFRSIGYQIFPEGVGIKDTFTLADFLAVREGRTVFVEVLSDTNVKPETLQRKAQLQQHGELCFILFSGTSRSDEPTLLAAKRAIGSWADVLYCYLHGYRGNRIEHTKGVSVAFDTTRDNGIRLAVEFKWLGRRKVSVSTKFLTHMYKNPLDTPISYCVHPLSYEYEAIFRSIFYDLAERIGATVKSSKNGSVTDYRAMRRKSGLKMVDANGRAVGYLKSEYRGQPISEEYMWTYHPSSRNLPPDAIYGVFELHKTGPSGLQKLIDAITMAGLSVQYEMVDLAQSLAHLE